MMFADVLLFMAMLLLGLSVFLLARLILGQSSKIKALNWATGEEPKKSPNGFINLSRPLVHNLSLAWAQKITRRALRNSIDQKLQFAGLKQELNVDEFLGLKILWGLIAPLFLLFLDFVTGGGVPWWFCVLLGFGGFYLPDIYARQCSAQRYTSIVGQLPFFVDLLALSGEAGLDFMQCLQRVCEKAPPSPLVAEFQHVIKDTKLGASRGEALKSMAKRVDVEELGALVSVVVDAEHTGASIAKVLKEQSAQMRVERLVRAEKAGARASQLILMPMMLFILPAIFLMVFAPVGLQFIGGG